MSENTHRSDNEEVGFGTKVFRWSLGVIRSFISVSTQKETRYNIKMLKKCLDVYAGPFKFYFKETLRKQKAINHLSLLFFISCASIFILVILPELGGPQGKMPFVGVDISTCGYECIKEELGGISYDTLPATKLISSFALLLILYIQLYAVERANTLTIERKKMLKILKEVGVVNENVPADVLYARDIGVFVDSKKMREDSLTSCEELWKTLNLDPGEPIRNQRLKSCFFVPTKFVLPESVIYQYEDFVKAEKEMAK